MQYDAQTYVLHILKDRRNVIIILEEVCEHHMKNTLQWCAGWRHASPPVVFRLKITTALPKPTAIHRVRSVKDTAVPDMAGFVNKLSSYTLTQLNELLEDDEKLNKFIDDSDEVSLFFSWRASRS